MARITIDITGNRYNNLTAIRSGKYQKNYIKWIFRCDCGREIEWQKTKVITGKKKSCGHKLCRYQFNY